VHRTLKIQFCPVVLLLQTLHTLLLHFDLVLAILYLKFKLMNQTLVLYRLGFLLLALDVQLLVLAG
jgi:hypothetical protein